MCFGVLLGFVNNGRTLESTENVQYENRDLFSEY